MTKLTSPITLARLLLLSAPVLAIGACAAPPPEPCDACAAAAHAQATADQALSTAQQALAAASASRTVSSEMYNRSLRK